MKLAAVEISNFMAIGFAKLDLADRGLVLIQGDNVDETSAISNGAGKSSIADAISWALYGMTARGEDGDKVVNRTAGKDCYVDVSVHDGEDHYQIRRFRKHKVGKNSVMVTVNNVAKSSSADLTKGTAALTQKLIDQIVGCSWDVFCGAVYAGQERMPDLPGKTDKELKMLIEEASGATLLEAAYQEAQRRLREAQLLYSNATTDVLRKNGMVDSGTRELHNAVDRQRAFEKMRIDKIKEWHTAGVELKTVIAAEEAKLEKMGDRTIIENRILALDKEIAGVEREKVEDRKLTELAAMAESNLRDAQREYHHAEKALISRLDQLKGLDHKVGCPCGTCDRPFTAEDIEPAKKIAAEARDVAKAAQLAAFKTLEERTKTHASAVEKRDDYRAKMTDISKSSDARANLLAELNIIARQDAVIADKRATVELLKKQMVAKKHELNPYIDDITKLTASLAAYEMGHKAAQEAEAKAVDAVKLQEAVAKVFSPAGVRAFLLDEVTPFLNDQTAKYLGTLSDGHISATWTTLVKTAKGELREKFSIEVTSSTGGDTFKGISGGEKRKVRIACALALQDLVARRATKPIELFIGDEIDDALDDAGLQRLMDILEEKAKERGSVFVISHSDLKDWIRNQVTVKKEGGKSTLEEVLA